MATETGTGEEHEEAVAASASGGGDGGDWVARWLAFIAAGCAFAGIAFALLRRSRDEEEGGPDPPDAGG